MVILYPLDTGCPVSQGARFGPRLQTARTHEFRPDPEGFQWSACGSFVEARQRSIVCHQYIVIRSDEFKIVSINTMTIYSGQFDLTLEAQCEETEDQASSGSVE